VQQYYHPQEIPNPMTSPQNAEACGRPGVPKSAICDPANLLSKDSKDTIEGFMNDIKTAQVGMTVINKMAKSFVRSDSLMKAGEKFARQVHDTWGVGEKATNNGVLIFISLEDHVVYISTGKGVQHLLSPSVISSVVEHMKTPLRAEKYNEAMERCVVDVKLVLSGDKRFSRVQRVGGQQEVDWVGLIFIVTIVAIGGIAKYFEMRKKEQLTQVCTS
jgi:uncharacterized protein